MDYYLDYFGCGVFARSWSDFAPTSDTSESDYVKRPRLAGAYSQESKDVKRVAVLALDWIFITDNMAVGFALLHLHTEGPNRVLGNRFP